MTTSKPTGTRQRQQRNPLLSASIPITAMVIVMFGAMILAPRFGMNMLQPPMVAALDTSKGLRASKVAEDHDARRGNEVASILRFFSKNNFRKSKRDKKYEDWLDGEDIEDKQKEKEHKSGDYSPKADNRHNSELGNRADGMKDDLGVEGQREELFPLKGPTKNLVKDDSEAGFILKGECESCTLDLQCRSQVCTNVLQCAGNDGLADGDGCKCALDDDCNSGYCNWGFTCAARIKNGETGCTENDDCESGLFCGIGEDLPFKCKSLKGAGSICAADSQCASGSCGWESFKCPSCCTGTPMPTPSPTASKPTGCKEHDDCKAGLYCAPTSECKPKQDADSMCLFDYQCMSGSCKYLDMYCPSCCEPPVSTPSPTLEPTTNTDTSSPTLPKATGCKEHDDCEAGLYCALTSECKPKQDADSMCVFDYQCMSGSCKYLDMYCPLCCEPPVSTPPPTLQPTSPPTPPPTLEPTSPPTPPPTPSPTPPPKQDIGSFCTTGSQCASGSCGWKSYSCPSCCKD